MDNSGDNEFVEIPPTEETGETQAPIPSPPVETPAAPVAGTPPPVESPPLPAPSDTHKRGPKPAWRCEKGHTMKDPLTGKAARMSAPQPKYCVDCEGGKPPEAGAPTVEKKPETPPPLPPTPEQVTQKIAEDKPKVMGIASFGVMPFEILASRMAHVDLDQCRVMFMAIGPDGNARPYVGTAREALTHAMAELVAWGGPDVVKGPLMPAIVTIGSVTSAIVAASRKGLPGVDMVPTIQSTEQLRAMLEKK